MYQQHSEKNHLALSTFFNQSTKPRLKTTFSCSKDYRQQFSVSTAQITMSVGQPVHEGERLTNVIQLVNRSFARCKIMIDDSIQWYTLAMGTSCHTKEELITKAIMAGDDYLERTKDIFNNNLTIPFEIIRWRDWMGTPEWERAIATMHKAYSENNAFHQAIDNCAHTFLTRYEKNHDLSDYHPARAKELCTHYLLEECGVMQNLWIKLGCHFEIYPSGRNEAMDATYKLFIEPQYPHLLRPVAIRFNRRNKEIPLISSPSQEAVKEEERTLMFLNRNEMKGNTAMQNNEEELLPSKTVLDNLLTNMPGHIYWKNSRGVYLGCNDKQAQSLGFEKGSEVMGKTDFELPWDFHSAKKFWDNDLEVLKTGLPKTIEESAIVNGQPIILLSLKAPIKNNQEDVIGVLGMSIDISIRKKRKKNSLRQRKQPKLPTKPKRNS